MINYFIYILLITIIFVIYVEINVGGILFRYNSFNCKTINVNSLLYFMIHPLKNTFLWNYKSLDINYIFILIISTMLYYFIKEMLHLIHYP